MISLTEKALDQILKVREREQASDSVLKIQVLGGGCSGLNYKLSFISKSEFLAVPEDKCQTFKAGALTYFTDNKSFLFLKNIEIDFEDGLNGKGFVFNNPNAKSKCGCGMSFGA